MTLQEIIKQQITGQQGGQPPSTGTSMASGTTNYSWIPKPTAPAPTVAQPNPNKPTAPPTSSPAMPQQPQTNPFDSEYGKPGSNNLFGSFTDWSNPNTVQAFFQSRGVTPKEGSAAYWAQKYNSPEFAGDREYFWNRLQNADEFTGGGGGSGGGEFGDLWGGTLEELVKKYLGLLDEKGKAAMDRGKILAGQFEGRATELDNPAYSSADDALIRAKAFDALSVRKQQTLKNDREKIYARGFEPTSGVAVGSDREINKNFEATRGGIESNLLESELQGREDRKNQALQLRGLAQQALAGGDSTMLEYMANSIGATKSPLDLMNSRFAQALQAAGSGGGSNDYISALMSILGAGQNNANGQNQAGANNAQGLASLLQLLSGYLN